MDFTSEIERLKTENQSLISRIEKLESNDDNKINSLTAVKNEVQAFASIGGHSKLLDTNSFFKKVLSLAFMIPLLGFCVYFVHSNYSEFKEYLVVTQLIVKEEDVMVFPAITLCSHDLTKYDANLSNWLISCEFKGAGQCSMNDFEYTPLSDPQLSKDLACYKFNGGRNAAKDETEIHKTSEIGRSTGLIVGFSVPATGVITYYVSDNQVQPSFFEMVTYVQPGKQTDVGFTKTIDTKLPEPYSTCTDNINPETSVLVRNIIERNMTYRQVKCYELCYLNYLGNYSRSLNNTINNVYLSLSFNYKGNCSHLCPLECQTISFDSTEHSIENFTQGTDNSRLEMNFFFSKNKHTELTQAIKTTEADLIANTGGVLGLFLELSFLSAYRFIRLLFDLVF